ncbi:hypothetical protein PL81_14695 [Streptomyces sp. RSD-27]|nr:hypothetical protein PL81_14695 [Streptomyces sp. RSD-27]
MSVSLDKNPATLHDAEPPLYIVVRQRPDGRISEVGLTDTAPDPIDAFSANLRATVWTTPVPEYEGDTAYAAKVLDLTVETGYRDENGHNWSEGERKAAAFHHNHTSERAHLRATEAHLIHAGLTDTYTGLTHGQGFGLIIDAAAEHFVFADPTRNGWAFATEDSFPGEDWCIDPGIIAPLNTSPRRLATAVLTRLAELDAVELADLSPLLRLRVTYGMRRLLIANAKYRLRQITRRYRHRITVRTR